MASDPSEGPKPVSRQPGQYLSLQPLTFLELPEHPDFNDGASQQRRTLQSFLAQVLTDAFQFDLENDWTIPGTPELKSGGNLVKVEQRVKGEGRASWLARRSFHHPHDVSYSEMDSLLAQDHCRLEAAYTPSVYDANELLKWDPEVLERATAEMKPEWRVVTIQMSIYQMFHVMPVGLLQDRVFHVLCVTVHSKYTTGEEHGSSSSMQALTLQLPININTFSSVSSVVQRSHVQKGAYRYEYPDPPVAGQTPPTSRQKSRKGNRLTEGLYVSMERLREADSRAVEGTHQWDMMTQSDAKGVTTLAPYKVAMKGTLDAVTKDVDYVLDHLRKQRQAQKV